MTYDKMTDVERDISGETVCGFRVAAYRETHPEHGAKYGHHYSEHWSTPNSRNPNVKVERLFTEDQLRAALAGGVTQADVGVTNQAFVDHVVGKLPRHFDPDDEEVVVSAVLSALAMLRVAQDWGQARG